MRSHRGFTLMEAAAAMALLACTLFVASGVVMQRRAVARRLDEHALALSAVSSRLAEVVASGSPSPSVLAYVPPESLGLRGARGTLVVEPWGSGLFRVRSEMTWSRGRVVRETLVAGRP